MSLDRVRRLFAKPYGSLHAAQAQALVEGGALRLDVREPAEWRAGHAPGARHVPLGALPCRMGEPRRGRSLVTVCRSGLPVVAKGGRPGRVA